LLGEFVELVKLLFRVVFRVASEFNPDEQKILDTLPLNAGTLFLNTLNGLLEIEPLRIGPDDRALRSVEVHTFQLIPKGIGYFFELPSLRRTLLHEDPLAEEVVCGKGVFLLVSIRTPTFLRVLPMGKSSRG
jgi:hypothetical protein